MIPPLVAGTGWLPVGRFPCEIDEVKAAFVDPFPASTRRPMVWRHWAQATEVLRAHVAVRYAWLGGSFVTDVVEPDDIDAVYWVEDTDISNAAADPASAHVLTVFQTPGALKAAGLQVDAFLIPWRSNPEGFARGPLDLHYTRNRGYWDDLWVRQRSGSKAAPKVRLDSIPRCGYLEVNLDGFPER